MSLVNSIQRMKRDLIYLYDLVQSYNNSQHVIWHSYEVEFTRIWDLYENLRTELILLDENLFSKLRQILKPEPDYSNHYFPEGTFNKNDLLPLINELNLSIQYFELYIKSITKNDKEISSDYSINLITSRFGKIVRQLRSRYDNRTTIEINDEYDMQDLFHSLLYLFYDDIRAEEWTPSYAGGCSRIDFLLKEEKVAIELKKTRKTLDAKELGKQLIVDIAKYKLHPDCSKLICFVYDPEFWIANPKGIENDLSQDQDGLEIKVIIEPK